MLGTEPPTELSPTIHRELSAGLTRRATDETSKGLSSDLQASPAIRPQLGAATVLAPLRTGMALALCDQVATWICLALAVFAGWLLEISLDFPAALPAALSGGLLIGYWAFGLYPGVVVNPVVETRQVVVSSAVVFAVTLIWVCALQPSAASIYVVAAAWMASLAVLPLGRMLGRAIFSRYAWWRQPIVTLGGSPTAQQLAARLRRLRTLGLEPLGLVDRPGQANRQNGLHEPRGDRPAEGAGYSGPPEQLAGLIENRGIRWAIMALPDACSNDAAVNSTDVLAAAAMFPHLLIVNENGEMPSLWSRTVDIDGCSALHSNNRLGIRASSGWRVLKRIIDVIVAGILVLALLPLFLVIAALILITSPGPVFYSQERVGRGGHPFRAWKFRTMRPGADRILAEYLKAHPNLRDEWAKNHKLRDDPRVIPGIGRVLRNYSLDEIPQLWNVLCGEMSLVGPRPIVEEEIPKYQDDFARYVQVSPGITGLWQISGRNNTTYSRRVFLDSYYVRNWSPWLDYYILLRTIKTVLLREGAY